jgi:hypothetical protein
MAHALTLRLANTAAARDVTPTVAAQRSQEAHGVNHRDTTTTERPTQREAGLPVSLRARSDHDAHTRYAVQAHVEHGTLPITLALYLDGDLLDMETSKSVVHDFPAADVPPGRHVVTVRAVDGTGRWGGASAVIEAPAPAFR